jgi:hypothetical protein
LSTVVVKFAGSMDAPGPSDGEGDADDDGTAAGDAAGPDGDDDTSPEGAGDTATGAEGATDGTGTGDEEAAWDGAVAHAATRLPATSDVADRTRSGSGREDARFQRIGRVLRVQSGRSLADGP